MTEPNHASPAPKKTPLYAAHKRLNARIVDFGGWLLPVNYGSQIDEHNAVRQDCGVFDVSHMTVSDITGAETLAFLGYLLANDIEKISGLQGKAMYSCMLNQQGGVIDDLIVYYLDNTHCRIISNAGTRDKDLAWLRQQATDFDVTVDERPELALIALQGPNALDRCQTIFTGQLAKTIAQLERFQGAFVEPESTEKRQELFVGRTGYTGEDGIELVLPAHKAEKYWNTLTEQGIQACGLGARDTLRLEAGMALYGNDLDESHNPLESGLAWTVSQHGSRDFIGKQALQDPIKYTLVGLVLRDKGVLREHQTVHLDGQEIGEITSGTFSPSLEKSIALARIKAGTAAAVGQAVQIAVRNKFLNAQIVRYPFIKEGKATLPEMD